jgi:hypothetical protein
VPNMTAVNMEKRTASKRRKISKIVVAGGLKTEQVCQSSPTHHTNCWNN